MPNFFEKLKTLFKKKNATSSESNKEEYADSFELDICWQDISKSETDNYIVSAMKRHGVYGYPTSSMIILEDGSEYIPEQLSDHWEAYNSSIKFKPKTITYNKLTKI